MSARHDVPQPALGLFLGHIYLGIWCALAAFPNAAWRELIALVTYRRTARDHRSLIDTQQITQKRLDDSEEHRFYLQLELEDMADFSASTPGACIHEAMDVQVSEMLNEQTLHIAVGSFRTNYMIPMITLRGAMDGCRYLAEEITRKSTKMFEAWLYGEVCRELKVPEERKGPYYPDGRVPVNMFEKMMRHS